MYNSYICAFATYKEKNKQGLVYNLPNIHSSLIILTTLAGMDTGGQGTVQISIVILSFE